MYEYASARMFPYPHLTHPQSEYGMKLEFEALAPFGEPVNDMGDNSAVRFSAEGINAVRYFPPSPEDFGSPTTAAAEIEKMQLEEYLRKLRMADADVVDPLAGLPTQASLTLARQGELFVARADLTKVDTEAEWAEALRFPLAPFRPDVNASPHRVTRIESAPHTPHGLVYTADQARGRWLFRVEKGNGVATPATSPRRR